MADASLITRYNPVRYFIMLRPFCVWSMSISLSLALSVHIMRGGMQSNIWYCPSNMLIFDHMFTLIANLYARSLHFLVPISAKQELRKSDWNSLQHPIQTAFSDPCHVFVTEIPRPFVNSSPVTESNCMSSPPCTYVSSSPSYVVITGNGDWVCNAVFEVAFNWLRRCVCCLDAELPVWWLPADRRECSETMLRMLAITLPGDMWWKIGRRVGRVAATMARDASMHVQYWVGATKSSVLQV